MRTSGVAQYALRMTFGQAASSSQVASKSRAGAYTAAASPDRVIMRSATMMAVFGIALSSFSLKQMLSSNNQNKATSSTPLRA